MLDSSVFIPLIKASDKDPIFQRFREEISANSVFYLCPVVFCEVLTGLYEENAIGEKDRFFSLAKGFRYVEFVKQDWEDTASIRSALRREGIKQKIPDVLIAIQANRLSAILITGNVKDFRHTANSVEVWP